MPTRGAPTLPLTAQLYDGSNSICWTAQYGAPSKNDSTQFKSKSD